MFGYGASGTYGGTTTAKTAAALSFSNRCDLFKGYGYDNTFDTSYSTDFEFYEKVAGEKYDYVVTINKANQTAPIAMDVYE